MSATLISLLFSNLSIAHFSIEFLGFFFLMVDLCRSFLYIPDINPLLALDITLISSQSVLERAYLPGPELALRVSMKFTC